VGESGSILAGTRLGLVAWLLIGAVVGGAVGAAGLRLLQERVSADHAGDGAPMVIVSVADLVRGGKDALEIRALADRLADGGFLVLDTQAVLAAPSELYLQAGQEQETAR
jgi:hypothetical protein